MNIYYVYAYIRQKSSKVAKAGTPYYIGKGKGNRITGKHTVGVPSRSHIIICENNLTEIGAFALERRLIRWWGRIDNNTGILRNRTDGGEGVSGLQHSTQTRMLISNLNKGKIIPKETIIKRELTKLTHRKNGYISPLSGINQSIDHINKRVNANTGKTRTDETKRKISESNAGKIRSEEFRKNLSNIKKGKPAHNKGKPSPNNGITQEQIQCPYCNKVGGISSMHRWHFDKCKLKI